MLACIGFLCALVVWLVVGASCLGDLCGLVSCGFAGDMLLVWGGGLLLCLLNSVGYL